MSPEYRVSVIVKEDGNQQEQNRESNWKLDITVEVSVVPRIRIKYSTRIV